MRVLITGSNGFIGKNLSYKLSELDGYDNVGFDIENTTDELARLIGQVDVIIHLAAVNRPKDGNEFININAKMTEVICDIVANTGRKIPIIFASSIQAQLDNPYGSSKKLAETALENLCANTGNPVVIYRLPGVFGKWCRPNYNSVVATFCYNIANNFPVQINDPTTNIKLVYVDDLVNELINTLSNSLHGICYSDVSPVYEINLSDLAEQITRFKNCRSSLKIERVGEGLVRALYSTYVSYLPTDKFVYDLTKFSDERGVFVEMLKTQDSGQFSFFTAYPGVTRGGHYHHTKTEKFLVIKGRAQFRFRQILTNECYEITTCGDKPQVVETVPGWTHDITNIGSEEMIVMLWANENFDRKKPDTISSKV